MLRRILSAWVVLCVLATTSGCAIKMNTRSGRKPDLAAVAQRLRLGQSTVDDVIAALGPPHGRGEAMLPIDDRPRSTWSYIYTEGSVNIAIPGKNDVDARTLLLFVFFDQDRYGGHLWFSSVKP